MSDSNASGAARLSKALADLDWQPRQLARRLQVQEKTVREWLAGRREVPPNLLDWIEARARGPQLPDGWDPNRRGS
jgi:hypothetical protein